MPQDLTPSGIGISVPTLTLRCQYAVEVAQLVERLAAEAGVGADQLREFRGKLLHRLFHWMIRAGTHFIDAPRALARLERLGRRVLRRARLKAVAPGRPIPLGDCVKNWFQLTYLEQHVLRLLDLLYSVEDIGLVMDITPNAVEYYRNQAAGKIHRAYVAAH